MSDVKKKKADKKKKEKRNNIVPFKKDLQVINNTNPVSYREAEIEKINNHAKEVFKELDEFADNCRISTSEVWYNLMFYAKQQMILSLSYSNFKIVNTGTTDEVTKNYAEFSSENFPELSVDNNNRKLH